MKGYVLDYVNENEFRKLERALKKYNMIAFKKLNFEYYPSLRNGKFLGELVESNKKNGTEKYELKLPSDKIFAQIHFEFCSGDRHIDYPFPQFWSTHIIRKSSGFINSIERNI